VYHCLMAPPNLYGGLPLIPEAEERFETLLAKPGVRIERIVSTGQASPPGFWYDQEQAEWVVLLQGSAGLRFADEDQARELKPGDWLHIAPQRRHRVEWTEKDGATVWLAFHFDA
jgi:cupin 2 domain-containing protein